MSETPPLTIRAWQPGDEAAILAAVNRVFPDIDPDFVPRTEAWWRWQFPGNPAGFRISLVIDESGRVVSQQASVPMRMRMDGEPALWDQVIDTFTDPELGLSEPKILAGDHFAEGRAGRAPELVPIFYALPQREAMDLAKRHLGWECLRNQDVLFLEPGRLECGASAGVVVETVERFEDEVDALFERVAEGRGAIAVRDARTLNWRFLEHPEREYVPLVARRDGQLVGVAVYRRGTLAGIESGLIADWLVPAEDAEASAALLDALVDLANRDGLELVSAMPESAPEWLAFQRAGFRVRPTPWFLIGRCSQRPYDDWWVYWNWYYTLGDLERG